MFEWLQQAAAALGDEFGWGVPDAAHTVRVIVRLAVAFVLGGMLGWERGRSGKSAGLRTHILVAVGSAVAVLMGDVSGMSAEGLSRIVQGALTGIGFIGGGAILKLSEKHQVKGLTTAANIWLTCAAGLSIGAGRFGLALAATIVALIVLSLLGKVEHELGMDHPHENH